MKKIAFLYKFLLLLILLFSSHSVFAQSSDSKVRDEEALAQVCKSISSKKITKGDFRQIKLILRLKREMVSSGVFVISADDGVLWNTQKPYYSTMAMTKSSIVQTSANGKKTVINSSNNATFEQFAKVLSSLFNGNAETLTENFEIEFIGSTDSWNINLVPKNSSVKKIIEQIDMAGHSSMELMTIHEPNGDYIRYEFMNHIYPNSLTPEEKAAFKN